MAPRTQRDYYSSGDPSRYTLRTPRHCEDNFSQLRNVDITNINGKEEFFQCIGLQMRKLQYRYRTSNGGQGLKKVNIPHGVVLRDCCVVISGPTCTMCGVCFKCETDLTVHVELKHWINRRNRYTAVKQTQCTGTENELRTIDKENFEHATIVAEKNLGTKLQKKLRLTLRIGEEVVAKMSVKRKHLMANTADVCTQTELPASVELPITKDVRKSIVYDIDPPVLSNSPAQCCNPTACRVDSQNRYFVASLVTDKQSPNEESTAQKENNPLNNLNELCATHKNEKHCAVPSAPLLPDLVDVVCSEKSEISSPEKTSPVHTKNVSILNDSSQFSDNSRTFPVITKNDSKSLANNTDRPIETRGQADSTGRNAINKVKDINGNDIQNDINISEKQRQSRSPSNIVQLVMPMILPIIVSNESNLTTPIKFTIEPTSLAKPQRPENRRHSNEERQSSHLKSQEQQDQHPWSQNQQTQQDQHPRSQNQRTQQEQYSEQEKQQQIQRWQLEEEREDLNSVTMEKANDDEIQEVLRIVRGRSISTEINHESPSRFEQAMLVQGAIRDMKRLEVEGWHLLSSDTMEPERKKMRYTKSDTSDSCSNVACNEDKTEDTALNRIIDTCISNTKEHIAKLHSCIGAMATCGEDNSKENLTCNRNMNIPSEVVLDCNFNYCDEVCEINNNTRSAQESVSRFLVPCSGGVENRGNGPAIIDLVSDTDE